jgi:NAD(P)-dependent dehydrogenase (short-subunit alcohol dehydrogenase family)
VNATSAHRDRPVAIVTGGGSGIGRATTLRLNADGYRLLVADVNDAAARETVSLAVSDDANSAPVAVHVDVRSEDDVAALIQSAMDRFGRLDTMVNNAGLGGAFGPVTEVEARDWDFTFEVLVRGVFFGIKHAARVMCDGSSIVNVASAAAYSAGVGAMAYSAAKAAVVSITRSAAVELAPRSIRVNAVCPGAIRTPLLAAGRADRFGQRPPPTQPLPRWGEAEDIAAAIAYLAGPDAAFVTGEALLADGGLVAAGPGPDFQAQLGTDLHTRGLVGVNRGTTGEPSQVHRRLS